MRIATSDILRTLGRLSTIALLFTAAGCASTGSKTTPVYFPAKPATPHVVHLKSFNSLHSLVPPQVTFVDVIRGGAGSPYVGTPAGVAYRDGHLYICDTDAAAVHDWNLATGKARRIGASGDTTLVTPVAVAVDAAGRVCVADTGRSEVVVFASGSEVKRLKPAGRDAYRPVAVAVHGSTLFVADIASHVVDRFSLDDGSHQGSIGKAGSGEGEFYFPMGVATDAKGRLFASDMMNARVQAFDSDGNATLSFGQPGDRYGDMGKPKQLAVGPDGTIFVADSEFAHVHMFNDAGQLLMLLGGSGDSAGSTPMPIGVAVAETLPEPLAGMVPSDFDAAYYLFVTNSLGTKRVSLYAVGVGK